MKEENFPKLLAYLIALTTHSYETVGCRLRGLQRAPSLLCLSTEKNSARGKVTDEIY